MEGGMKVCINGPGHMTKMAAMPIYMAKTLKNLLLQNQQADFHRGLLPIIVCINDDPGVTLTYFTARLNLET